MMAINLCICVAVALATIGVMLLGTWQRRRIEQRTVKDSLNSLQRIMEALSALPRLPVNQRTEKRKEIARDILLDLQFVISMVMECADDDLCKNQEVRERTRDVLKEIWQLRWELRKALFLFRFRPKLVADCQRIFYAVHRHCGVWIAYVSLLKAKYPELYRDVSLW